MGGILPVGGVTPMRQAHKRMHAVIWTALALILPLILATAWSLRQHKLPEQPSQRLSALHQGGLA